MAWKIYHIAQFAAAQYIWNDLILQMVYTMWNVSYWLASFIV